MKYVFWAMALILLACYTFWSDNDLRLLVMAVFLNTEGNYISTMERLK